MVWFRELALKYPFFQIFYPHSALRCNRPIFVATNYALYVHQNFCPAISIQSLNIVSNGLEEVWGSSPVTIAGTRLCCGPTPYRGWFRHLMALGCEHCRSHNSRYQSTYCTHTSGHGVTAVPRIARLHFLNTTLYERYCKKNEGSGDNRS